MKKGGQPESGPGTRVPIVPAFVCLLKVKNAYAAVTAQAKLKREEQARQSSRQEIVHSIAEADVLTSELTDLLIEKVYVFPDNRIEIVYKVHDLFE